MKQWELYSDFANKTKQNKKLNPFSRLLVLFRVAIKTKQ